MGENPFVLSYTTGSYFILFLHVIPFWCHLGLISEFRSKFRINPIDWNPIQIQNACVRFFCKRKIFI